MSSMAGHDDYQPLLYLRDTKFVSTVTLAVCTACLLGVHFVSQSQAISSYGEKLRLTSAVVPGTEGLPQIAWLMHYPKTGAKFTQMLIHKATRTTTGTNYGNTFMPNLMTFDTIKTNSKTSDPVYSKLPDGPFRATGLALPTGSFLLTETQCARFCHYCKPESYVTTLKDDEAYRKTCTAGKHYDMDSAEKTNVEYNPALVKRALHLVRNPYDVIVSRFHDERQGRIDKNDQEFLERYPDSPDGFQSFCHDLDFDSENMKMESQYYTPQEFQLSVSVPCHAEMYRYIHWLNMAFATSRNMHLPTLIVHYEDFHDNLQDVVSTIFEFLDLEIKDSPPDFNTPNRYKRTFYSLEQRIGVKNFVEHIASDDLKEHIVSYFENLSDSPATNEVEQEIYF